MSFADLEARTNAAVLRRLSNARGSFGVDSDFPVIFDRAWVDNQGISSTQPVCQGKTSDLGAATHGTAITIGGTAYSVIDNQPDGTGMTTLVLQLA